MGECALLHHKQVHVCMYMGKGVCEYEGKVEYILERGTRRLRLTFIFLHALYHYDKSIQKSLYGAYNQIFRAVASMRQRRQLPPLIWCARRLFCI